MAFLHPVEAVQPLFHQLADQSVLLLRRHFLLGCQRPRPSRHMTFTVLVQQTLLATNLKVETF